MIRIEADHLVVRSARLARVERGCAVSRIGDEMGKGLLGFGLALRQDVSPDDARLILSAAPADLDRPEDVLAWLGKITFMENSTWQA